jgi:predicted ATPase
MIESLEIQNFKNWKNTGAIEMKPLTVFFGSNSSGKSSIGQFLMLLKQSVESSDRKAVFFPGDDSSAVDLGLPSDLVYCHDQNQAVKFVYKWGFDKTDFNDALARKSYAFNAIEFSATVKVHENGSQAVEIENFLYKLLRDDEQVMEVGIKRKDGGKGKRGYQLVSEGYDFTRVQGRTRDIASPIRFYGFPDEALAYYRNADSLKTLNLLQETLFSRVYYLGPMRQKAKRLYSWAGSIIPDSVGYQGENSIAAILAAQNEKRKINYRPNQRLKDFNVVVAEMLQEMKLVKEIKIDKISDNRQDYDVKVITNGSRSWVDIPDVGFGVSQVLPVITEVFYAPIGSTVIMEQPEIHLHPAAQAGLADVFINAIKAREESKPRNMQLIVESHSEHFLRRLQRRIAEKVLSADDLRVYFVNTESFPPKLEALQVDLFGNIANWPKNFFGDISGDIYARTDAALKRRLEANDA